MPSIISVPSNLLTLSALLKNASNGQTLYIKKDNSGNVQLSNLESVQTNSLGYEFVYPDGNKIYTIPAISSYASIPWDYTLAGLNTLNTSNLVLWIDAKETKSISQANQIVYSKTNYYLNENTTNYSFTYTTNDTIDLSLQGALETASTIQQKAYWVLCMVVTLTSQTLTNNIIFQHNDISLRISGPRLAPDAISNTYMIALHLNGVFKQGITFKPSDTNFKYLIYCNQGGNLQISGNLPSQVFSGSFSSGSNYKCYIGQDSSGGNNAYIKLHELFYYTDTTDIGLSYSTFSSYLTSKHSLTTYTDAFNVIPILNPLTLATSTMYWECGSSSGNNLLNFQTSTTIFTPNNGASINNSTLTVGSITGKAGYINSPGGTNVYYNCSDNSLFTSTIQDPFTIITILRASVDGRFWATAPIGGQLNNSMHNGLVISFSNSISNMQYNLSGNVNLTQSNFYIVSCAFSGGQYNPSTLTVRINGAAAYNVYNGSSSGSNSNITQNYIAWSVAGGGQSQCWAFFFAKSALSLSTIQKLEGLMVHNNFTNASSTNILDASHPYKNARPTSFA